jgi:hypothetical protein
MPIEYPRKEKRCVGTPNEWRLVPALVKPRRASDWLRRSPTSDDRLGDVGPLQRGARQRL